MNCPELNNIRRDTNALNTKLLGEFNNDFSKILKRIINNNKYEVYQTLNVTQEEVNKILGDSQKTIEQQRSDVNKALNSMRGFMDNSYSLLADVTKSLVENFSRNISNTKDDVDSNAFNTYNCILSMHLKYELQLCIKI